MKIVHASDLHGNWFPLPPADLYVFTGDMLPNFPVIHMADPWGMRTVWFPNLELLGDPPHLQPFGRYLSRRIDRRRESDLQRRWCERQDFRSHLGNPDAPVVVVDGNHDFTELAPHFKRDFHDVLMGTFTLPGTELTFGGIPFVPPISGEWNWERNEADIRDQIDCLPDVDVLVTHSPPHGVLDEFEGHLGSQAIRAYVERRMRSERPLRAHLFGHIHGRHGVRREGEVLFSNAATTFHELEIT